MKIIYERLFNLGNYENERFSVGIEIELGCDIQDAFIQAENECYKAQKQSAHTRRSREARLQADERARAAKDIHVRL